MRRFRLPSQKDLHGEAPHGAVRQGHRGQWRIQPGGKFDLVVKTRHCNIVRNATASAGKRRIDFHCHAVVAAQYGVRLLTGSEQRVHMRSDKTWRAVAVDAAAHRREHAEWLNARLLQRIAKALLAQRAGENARQIDEGDAASTGSMNWR